MQSSSSSMNFFVISGQILKSIFIIIMIALALSLLGFFETNSQAKNDTLRISETIELNDKISKIQASEERIKHNINKLSTLENGLNVYSFQYKSEPTTYVGFLAHELAQNNKFKEFVIHMGDGHYAIHYEKLGFQPITLKSWQQAGMSAFKTSTSIASQE